MLTECSFRADFQWRCPSTCAPNSAMGVETLFGNEPASSYYALSRNNRIDAAKATKATSLIRLDAIMTGIIDSFKPRSNTCTGDPTSPKNLKDSIAQYS